MGITVNFLANLREDLANHLFSSRTEEVAFLLADFSSQAFTVRSILRLPQASFDYKGAFHVALKDEVRQDVIKWAWNQHACLIEAHSHLVGPAKFSPTDWEGLHEFVPHIWWRLRARPYLALVFSPEDFDGLCWIASPQAPTGIEALISPSHQKEYPTNLSIDGLQANHCD